MVTAGDKVWAEGTGCKQYASVKIKLDGKTVKRTYADKHGTFDKGVRIPWHTKKGRHVLSAKCGGRYLGSDGVKVKKKYKQHRDHMLRRPQRGRGRQEAPGPWRRLPRRRSGRHPRRRSPGPERRQQGQGLHRRGHHPGRHRPRQAQALRRV